MGVVAVIIIFILIALAIIIPLILWKKKIKKTDYSKDNKINSRPSGLKIALRIIGIIMFISGFSLTLNMPKNIYGVTWYELGAMAEGNTIENTVAMLNFLDIQNIEDIKNIEEMKTKAYDALEVSLLWTCVYWFVCSGLLFIHIKNVKVGDKNDT